MWSLQEQLGPSSASAVTVGSSNICRDLAAAMKLLNPIVLVAVAAFIAGTLFGVSFGGGTGAVYSCLDYQDRPTRDGCRLMKTRPFFTPPKLTIGSLQGTKSCSQ